MNKLLLVDGSNLLFQMFYGIPSKIIGSQGKPIHGTIGFIGALLRIIRMIEPTHMFVAFDGEICNSRNDLLPEYKGNRPNLSALPEEETPFCQLPDIFAALDYMQIPWAETKDCEADDWLAAYAVQCSADTSITIVSHDSDYFQLINEKVTVLRYRGGKTELWDEDHIRNKFGISACQYADWKAMVGDTADNIRGAEKVGPKTATWLLQQYGTLNAIIQNSNTIPKAHIASSIQTSKDQLLLNLILIRLDGAASLPFSFPSLMWQPSVTHTTGEILKAIYLR